MATIRIVLVIFCLGFAERNTLPHGHLLKQEKLGMTRLLAIANQEVGIREASGHNDGQRVAAYLAAADLRMGAPWCAAFVCWVFRKAGYAQPRTGWSPALFNSRVHRKKAAPGLVFGIWFPELHRIAHVGFVADLQHDWVISIEGNSNADGSREGDGVYRKRRPLHLIYDLANWLPEEGGTP
ncbi:MAG: peptidoglycan-binding protein [Bacteroidetes bacterium]|nr:peptidoglycan-binding protein [Bacteroidota bacterium]MBU1372244.1 peptidoglycan-binding protein [Bacteroidota bacterium]MBU1484495.1 peptidoglycan-binding protein [Bacteroidota bacterium]MBU1759715.1 peptidoglycan-binding protein [Bacteroidota bacterium]MBU2045654.1 peptidoglycan-binding protein [Bacteroidota bacterium]